MDVWRDYWRNNAYISWAILNALQELGRIARRNGTQSPAPSSLLFAIRNDGGFHPELNCRQGRHIVIHRVHSGQPRPEEVLTPTAWVVLYQLRELLSRSPGPASRTFHFSQARRMFRRTIKTLRFVDVVQCATIYDAVRHNHLARGVAGIRHHGAFPSIPDAFSFAAGMIVQCLLLLQTETKPALRMCLGCAQPPVLAPTDFDIPGDTEILEVHSKHCNTTGYTTSDVVSILPPVREIHSPMLCEHHQKELKSMLWKVLIWPVPDHLNEISWPWNRFSA